jgi:hypothetical protein
VVVAVGATGASRWFAPVQPVLAIASWPCSPRRHGPAPVPRSPAGPCPRPGRRDPVDRPLCSPLSPSGRLPAALLRLQQHHPGEPLDLMLCRATYWCSHCWQPLEQFKTGSAAGRASWRAGQTPPGAGGRDVDEGGAPPRRGPSGRRCASAASR